jgi:hypothetical protein
MTEVQAAAAAYACSAATITLLWVLARRNRAQGWFRQRHPNCYVVVENPTPVSQFFALPPQPAALGSQLLALHEAIARDGVTAPGPAVPQDQYVNDSAATAKST